MSDTEISPSNKSIEDGHWGKDLILLIESLDLSDWESMDMADPVEWVNNLRKQEESRLKAYWDGDK